MFLFRSKLLFARNQFVWLGLAGFLIVCVLAELLYTGFLSDVEFLIPLHECEQNQKSYLNGEPTRCPLAKSSNQAFVVFGKHDLNLGERQVIIADTSLNHSQKTSLFFEPLRFAVVTLDDGTTLRWVGRESDYQKALEDAHKNDDGMVVNRFFARSFERSPEENSKAETSKGSGFKHANVETIDPPKDRD